jgi:RNA polymerase-interacting CarD/CdnL/TRCF family regulator
MVDRTLAAGGPVNFHIEQRVVYPAFGLGRMAALVTKSYLEPEANECYEVVGEHSTLWVPVREAAARGLRPLTRPDELPSYRGVLRATPVPLNPDPHYRYRDTRQSLQRGTFQALCEIVRDLSAYSWREPLGAYDVLMLRKSRHWLCQEWAAAEGVSLAQATAEVDALLLASRRALHG